MPFISVTRNMGWFGLLRAASIVADDLEIGRIKCGEIVEVNVPDHAINLYAKMDWGRSKPYPICKIRDGQMVYMNAWFSLNPLRNLGIIPIPIALEDKPR